MNAQRFVAPNSREAMALARAAFGDHAVILSSRSTTSKPASVDRLDRITA